MSHISQSKHCFLDNATSHVDWELLWPERWPQAKDRSGTKHGLMGSLGQVSNTAQGLILDRSNTFLIAYFIFSFNILLIIIIISEYYTKHTKLLDLLLIIVIITILSIRSPFLASCSICLVCHGAKWCVCVSVVSVWAREWEFLVSVAQQTMAIHYNESKQRIRRQWDLLCGPHTQSLTTHTHTHTDTCWHVCLSCRECPTVWPCEWPSEWLCGCTDVLNSWTDTWRIMASLMV